MPIPDTVQLRTPIPISYYDASQLPQPEPNTSNFLENSFDKTNLDLENSDPAGGPINDPNSNFVHFYTPSKPYDSTPEGTIRGEGILQSTTGQTNLDVENSLPFGGPINTAYATRIGGQPAFFSTTHPFTPRNTYADSFNPIPPGILI
jgi:hypothetical protein